jgi:hypothetical protein
MAGELRLDQHLPSKLVDAYGWRDATQAEVWQVSEAAFAADSLYAREHGAIARPDTVHPDAAGNVLQAALYLACAADYGIEV